MRLFSNRIFSKSLNFNIQKYKEELLGKGLSFFAITIPFAVLISILRTIQTEWQNIYFIHIILSSIIIFAALFQKKLSYRIKAVIFLGAWLLLAIFGLFSFGLLGGGLIILVLFSLFSSLLYGVKGGITSSILSTCIIITTGLLISSGKFTVPIDTEVYATAFTSWLVLTIMFFLFIPVIIMAIGLIYRYLQTSLENYKNLIDHLQETFLYRHDTNGIMTYVSPSITDILGYPSDEFLGHYDDYLTDHPLNKKVVELTENSLRGEIQPPYELQIFHKNGAVKWLSVSERPVFSDNGSVLGIEGIAHDITERKNREMAVNNLLKAVSGTPENRFFDSMTQQLAKSLNCNYALIGKISEIDNSLIETLSFYTDGTIVQNISYSLKHSLCKKAISQGACIYPQDVHRLFPEDQLIKERSVEGYAVAPLKDKNDNTIGIMAVLSKAPLLDTNFINSTLKMFSERTAIELIKQKSESQRVTLEEYLLNIINSMPSILIGVDRNLRITQWNKEAEKISGKTADKVIGEKFITVYPELYAYAQIIEDAIRQGNAIIKRRVHFVINSRNSFVNIMIYPLVRTASSGAVIRIDNVTEQIKIEEMLIQNEKVLSLGGLASGMAHEINNPLSGILQSADLIKKRLLDDIHIEANVKMAEEAGIDLNRLKLYLEGRNIPDYIDLIQDSGIRVKAIMANMLDYSRKSTFTKKSHDLGRIMDETLDFACHSFETGSRYNLKSIQIQKEYEEPLPPVICEKTRIQQVFLNILRNGAQAMEKAQTRNPQFAIRIFPSTAIGNLIITIQDNGPGMDDETASQIFEPFFTTREKEDGTGLGLSVSYFIITENYGGQIKVETAPGKGTTFIIEIPLAI